jgi:hypothetical protein
MPTLAAAALFLGLSDVPSYAPLRIPDPAQRPVLDGVLDEPIWRQAPVLSDFRQAEPVEGGEPTERTEVRVVYDEKSLFIGVLCRDRDPSTIRATIMERDASLRPDDSIAILLDTFHDRRSAFYFQVGAAGGMHDALVAKNGAEFNEQWDGIWDARARVTAEGWVAEIEIPFATLSFRKDETTWGFNVQRLIRRDLEYLRWATPSPRIDFVSVANAGALTGLTGMQQSAGVDFVPFAVGKHVNQRGSDRSYSNGDVGFDLYWHMTPNLKLSLSANTDFAETEVDDRQVNLTRFPLFFPEKRRFFLEDANNFVFGQSDDTSVLPYFSRRIGLDANGQEVPILAAAKLTGRTDDFSLGLMNVETDDLHDLDRQNLTVGRYEQNLFDQSTAGVIFTHGDPSGAAQSSTYGADYNYRTDKFCGDRNLRAGTWFLRTDTDGVTGDDEAYDARIDYPNDEVEAGFDYLVVGKSFDPLLGFVERTGIKQYTWQAAWNPRLTGPVRQIFFEVEPKLITDMSNSTETSEVAIRPFGFITQQGDEGYLRIRRVYDHVDADFDIVPGVTIPADGYHFTRYGASAESSSGRPWTLTADVEFGPFYGGRETAYVGGLVLRPDKHVTGSVEYEDDVGHLPGGDFEVRVTRVKLDLLFSPRLVWSNFIQHDTISDSLGLNSRLWWILDPGSNLYLVLNQGWIYSPDRFAPTDTELTVKLGYTLRF